ncbi:MAG: chitobiase/beta-hexosaminidase C-terminal domain-containing protein [Candidatus Falkowbacteria bacterium]|nr:chitobiase/beta-hexosaminidase C-terminal domain-containing protein [Candidatus Falkowbacteria bacterium]
MKKIPILIISLALFLFFAPLVSATEITGNLGESGLVSGITGGIPNDPVASPASGHSATSAFTVTLSATNSTSIRYTADGSAPACPATGTLYAGAITINASKTIRAIACYAAGSTVPSNVVSFSYIISGGGGGGGSSTVYCTAVTYTDWNATCFANIQTRTVASSTPSGCSLTSAQQLDTQRTCPIATSTPPIATSTPPVDTSTPSGSSSGNTMLINIATEAEILFSGDTNWLLTHLGISASTTMEQASLIKYKTILGLDSRISAAEKATINDFIIYGTLTTHILGAGERAAVINSYYQAYGRLPNSVAEWSDVLKIANGRWPSERNAATEARAKVEFKKVYVRDAVMTNNIDENAIRVAIVTFRWVYGHNPVTALAWNIVRAIAYSGAKR